MEFSLWSVSVSTAGFRYLKVEQYIGIPRLGISIMDLIVMSAIPVLGAMPLLSHEFLMALTEILLKTVQWHCDSNA